MLTLIVRWVRIASMIVLVSGRRLMRCWSGRWSNPLAVVKSICVFWCQVALVCRLIMTRILMILMTLVFILWYGMNRVRPMAGVCRLILGNIVRFRWVMLLVCRTMVIRVMILCGATLTMSDRRFMRLVTRLVVFRFGVAWRVLVARSRCVILVHVWIRRSICRCNPLGK